MKGWYRVMSMTGRPQNHGQQKKGDVHKIIRILLLEDGGSGTEAPVLRTWRKVSIGDLCRALHDLGRRGRDVLKLFKKTLFLNGPSPSFTIERKSECGCVGGTVRETKRRIERRAQELWFKLDAPLRAF